ncbi:MAG: YtxH domain-containing protein [Actinobacteria bacterium]|nr:YtxH domain-containing protein [Actinomycetota bacterium]
MAKFSKFLFGGIVGAGVALLFAPKPGRELRQMLLGSGRPALPRPEAPAAGPASTAPGDGVNFESRLAETRRQVETQLAEARPGAEVEAAAEGSPVGAAAGEEAAAALELKIEAAAEAELEPGAEAAALVEEDFIVEETAAETPVAAGAGEEAEAPEEPAAEPPEAAAPPLATTPGPEQAEPAEPVRFPAEELESEMAEEELAAAGLEAEAETEDWERAAESDETMEPPAAPPERPNLAEMAQVEPEPEADMFSDLKTPVEGEPTVAGENEPEPEAAAPAAPAPAAAPQPSRSRLDQDEMRRRIDETRARLKAKAFDAMVSGETFVETEADRDRKRERLSSPELEGTVETQIDRIIKEDS